MTNELTINGIPAKAYVDDSAAIANVLTAATVPTADKLKQPKYFLCYGFEDNTDLKNYHVTLIYFGELQGLQLKVISQIVDKYFDFIEEYNENCPLGNTIKAPTITFDKMTMFGKNKDIPVLLPKYENSAGFLLPVLRKKLEGFKGGDSFPFNPHLTVSGTDLETFTGKIDRLCLCSNGYEVLQTWKFPC